jgi:hypothetical protein
MKCDVTNRLETVVQPAKWTVEMERKEIASRTQIPLILAWYSSSCISPRCASFSSMFMVI